MLVVWVAEATPVPLYSNSGSVTNPIVDATSFLNQGYFETTTDVPYETANTLNYTNRGTITGSIGFRFSFHTNFLRRASSFDNEGTIQATDGFLSTGVFGGTSTSFLYVDSTNIINRGTMGVTARGLLQLTGNKIDLKGGALVASDSTFAGYTISLDSVTSTNYSNEPKITDLYWGTGTNNVFKGQGSGIDLGSGQMDTNSFFFGSGNHDVVEVFSSFLFTNSTQVPQFSGFFSSSYATFAISNRVSPTSSVIQVVFVATNAADPDMRVDARFSTSNGGGGIRGRTALVQFSVLDTNVITGLPTTNSLYFADSLPIATTVTNVFYQNNRSGSTLRPNAYDVTFYTPSGWQTANATNVNYSAALLYDPAVHFNSQPDNYYAAYSVNIGSQGSTNSANSAILNEPSNSVGRVEIIGDYVDVNLARIQSQGLLTISATNFQALNQGARLDAEQMRLNLTSTNQTFILTNLLGSTVRRLAGTLRAYSCTWSNQTIGGQENRYHVLIIENGLASTQPATAYGFSMKVTNQANSSIIIEDPLTVAREFFLDAKNITLRDSLSVSDTLNATNMPSVMNLTNEGTISVPNSASFANTSGALTSFVNRSNIFANSLFVHSGYFQNTGIIAALAGSVIVSNSANGCLVVLSGTNFSTFDFDVVADTLRASNSVVMAGSVSTNFFTAEVTYNLGGLLIKANSLYDNNGGTNLWSCLNGFQLLKLNSGSGWTGDLLHTELKSTIKPFGYVEHTWSGADFGVSAAGFTNNAALGKLIIDIPTSGQAVFHAPSSSGSWALYVDYLDLRNFATNWQTAVQMDPNFHIYFADCNIRPEKLDQIGGLFWVKTYAGAYSGTNVVINGQPTRMNRALYTSSELDSDGDGIPNSADASPFDGVVLSSTTVTNTVPPLMSVSWQAAANVDYTIEYATNLQGTNTLWTTLTTLHATSAGVTNVFDSISNGLRVYRVRYSP